MKTKLALAILLLTLLFSFEKGMAQVPNWAWAKSAGGTSSDYGNNICTDANGNVLVTGIFSGNSITFGTITLMGSFVYNIFVVKYDPLGNVLWAKSAGGTGFDEGYSIATDVSGNVLVTGAFGSDSITFGTTTLINATPPSPDVFIVKYDASGNVLWAKSAGGTGWDLGYKITSDASGNVVLTGYFESATITFGTTSLTNSTSPNGDIFIVKYDASGNVLWTKSTGGTKDDAGYCISTDASGNILLTGVFESDSITFGTSILTNANADSSDIFVVKYDASGNVLWAKSAGGGSDDISTGISTDVSGNVIITGRFQSASITFGTTTLSNTVYQDMFIVKYDALGNVLWAKSTGGTFDVYGCSISSDVSGNILVTGAFRSDTIIFGTTTLINAGSNDIFVVKYDASGNVLWAKSAGGASYDVGIGISTDANENVLVTGYFDSDSITLGTTTITNAGVHDIFIAKLDGTTGIAEQNLSNNLTLYPNPANDYITIKTNNNKKQLITITDITGKIIYSTATLSVKTIINTKDFPQGVYAVQVQAGDAVQTRKVIVVR